MSRSSGPVEPGHQQPHEPHEPDVIAADQHLAGLTDEHLTADVHRAIAGLERWYELLAGLLGDRLGSEVRRRAELIADRAPLLVSAAPPVRGPDDHRSLDPGITDLPQLKAHHDRCVDRVSVLLSEILRSGGAALLHHCFRVTGEQVMLGLLERDVKRSPRDRLQTWVRMLRANFAELRVEETDRYYLISQDPCGTCGSQVADRAAVAEQLGLATVDGGPIYRAHVQVWHTVLPRERIGVPWPVIRCPAAGASAPCRVYLFKDPFDPRANDLVRGGALPVATSACGRPAGDEPGQSQVEGS